MTEKKPKESEHEALPVDEMDKTAGYSADITAPSVKFVPPPSSYSEATSSPESYATSGFIDENEARRILVAYAKSRCCWRTGAAQELTFRSVNFSTAIHYALKTFLETRSTKCKSVPFTGQRIDGPKNGVPPAPWAVEVPMPAYFNETTYKCEVPHTASVKSCYWCRGSGRIRCDFCHGSRHVKCYKCGGLSRLWSAGSQQACNICFGSGRQMCNGCDGTGKTTCSSCRGVGKWKCFIQLKATFKNHVKDYILERTQLPDHLVRDATGKILFEDTQPLLIPIQAYPEAKVNRNSAAIIQEHRGLGKSGRIWMQNHAVRSVPVCHCECEWDDRSFHYYVYGDNRLVHAPKYPQQCCCALL